jgi:hypothetical protein
VRKRFRYSFSVISIHPVRWVSLAGIFERELFGCEEAP